MLPVLVSYFFNNTARLSLMDGSVLGVKPAARANSTVC
jgi:hypothetical protein